MAQGPVRGLLGDAVRMRPSGGQESPGRTALPHGRPRHPQPFRWTASHRVSAPRHVRIKHRSLPGSERLKPTSALTLMPNLVPLSRDRHAGKGWRRLDSYAFAAHTALVPLVASELPKAAMSLPIAFIRQDEHYVPVAVLGLEPTTNLFVAPDGRWIGAYIPSALRGHPFALAYAQTGEQVLCLDEDSGLLTEAGQGESFFDEKGEPSEGLRQILAFLQQIELGRQHTTRICDLLAQLGLIQPWPIQIRVGQNERRIQGLFRSDESALNQLSDAHFIELRRAGGLPLVYCQLLAMQHIGLLGRLVDLRANAAQTAARTPPPFSFSLEDQDILRFDWD